MSKFEEMLEYLDKMGVKYTINRNPTEEEVKRIREKIEKQIILMERLKELPNRI